MFHPQVSIIVAAWNAEAYLSRSLDSIVKQTFRDWEVILVDDGSDDQTGAIADKYSADDNRIKVIHQPHGGLAKARQTGLDSAVGVFSIFADADDWLEDDMLELMYDEACRTSSDIVFCDYIEENNLGTFYRKQEPAGYSSKDVLPQMLGQMHGSLCTKLIKKTLYDECGVRFVGGLSYCDDECVVIPILAHNVRVSYVGKGLYHYDKMINPSSDSNVWKKRTAAEYQLYLDRIEPYFNEPELKKVYQNKVAELVKRLTYAPQEHYADNQVFFQRHKDALMESNLPFVKKMFCYFFFNGFQFLAKLRNH